MVGTASLQRLWWPPDRIAILERWVPIDFDPNEPNVVGCVTAWCWPELARKEFIYRNGASLDYFGVGAGPTVAAQDMCWWASPDAPRN